MLLSRRISETVFSNPRLLPKVLADKSNIFIAIFRSTKDGEQLNLEDGSQ